MSNVDLLVFLNVLNIFNLFSWCGGFKFFKFLELWLLLIWIIVEVGWNIIVKILFSIIEYFGVLFCVDFVVDDI